MIKFLCLTSMLLVVNGFENGSANPKEESSLLVGYDCGGSKINKTVISLVDLPVCKSMEKNITTEKKEIQLVQVQDMKRIKMFRCEINAVHHLFRCGKTIDTMQEGGLYSEVVEVSRDQCIAMHARKIFEYNQYGVTQYIKLGLNERTRASFTSMGSINAGSCSGEKSVFLNGRHYDRAVRNSNYEILIYEGDLNLDLDESKVITNGGERCEYKNFECYISGLGNVFWDNVFSSEPCKSDKPTTVLYQGIATKTIEFDKEIGKIVTYIVDYNSYQFQLAIMKDTVTICQSVGYQTEHPKLLIIERVENLRFPKEQETDLKIEDINIMTYLNSKFVYVLRHMETEIKRLYETFALERCKTENRILKNMLTLAVISPKDFAYEYTESPGYTAVVRGEVIHISQCSPAVVQYYPPSPYKCYQELPVSYNNKSYFLVPRSKLLIQTGTEVDCVGEVSSHFRIGDEWFTPAPYGLVPARQPIVINHEPIHFQLRTIKNLAIGGIYTQEELNKIQKAMVSPIEQSAITSGVYRSVSGRSQLPDGYSFVNSFKDSDYDSIRSRLSGWWDRMIERLTGIGNVFSLVIGCVLIVKCIIAIINIFINGFFLQRELGWSWKLLLCWWENLVHLILRSSEYKSNRNNRVFKRQSESEYSDDDEKEEIQLQSVSTISRPIPSHLKGLA